MRTRSAVLLAASLSAGCAATGGTVDRADAPPLRARGNEPAWSLDIDASLRFESGRLHVAGPATPLRVDGERRRYAAALRDRAIPVTVEVVAVPGVCRDSMSGMPHPLRVEVAVDGRRFDGCGGEPAALLRGGEWTVAELAGERVEAAAPTLSFGEDGRLGGRASCNAYSATYALTGETLAVGRAAVTRMACPPPRMAQEARFLELLQGVRRFDIADDGSLVLIGDDGRAIRAHR